MINRLESVPTKHRETKQKRNMRLVSVSALAGAAILGGSLVAKSDSESRQPKQPVAEVREALEHTPEVMQGVVVLRGGVNLRRLPRIDNGDPAINDDGNIAETVSPKKVVVATRPLVVVSDSDNKMWIGFALQNGKDADPKGTDMGDLVFAAYEELSEQDKVLFRPVETPDSVHPFTHEVDGVAYLVSSDEGPVAVGRKVDADLADAGVAYAATQIQMPEILDPNS